MIHVALSVDCMTLGSVQILKFQDRDPFELTEREGERETEFCVHLKLISDVILAIKTLDGCLICVVPKGISFCGIS